MAPVPVGGRVALARNVAAARWRSALAFLLASLLCLPAARAITFDLVDRGDRPAGQGTPAVGTKCVSEEIASAGVLVVGEYSVVAGSSKITVKASIAARL